MKKFINLVVFLFSIFFIGNISVFASNNPYTVSAHDINPDTYIIGTHMFDEDRTYLSTEDIMWAARTIDDAESKDDMIIYYKNYNGEWINGRTGENITVPSTFKIEEYNGEKAKLVLIDTVLEEFEIDGTTYYTSIDEDDYYEMGLLLKKESNTTEFKYEIMFNVHNIEDGDYNFNLQCNNLYGTETSEFNVGTMPNSVTVSNGTFRLPVVIDATELGYAICEMELTNDEEEVLSTFDIASNDAEPTLDAIAIGMAAHEVNGEGIGFYPVFADYPNNFYDIYDSSIEINGLVLDLKYRFIEYGDYNIEIIATKDGEEVNIEYDNVFLVGEGDDILYGPSSAKHYLAFDESITPGEYEFEITLTDVNDELVTTEYVYLTVTDETKMVISSEVWEDPEIYYSLDELVFDNSKKRKFNMAIFTENIPVGTYAIKAELEYVDMIIPSNITWKANQNVKIIKSDEIEYFDYSFEIPKGAFEGDYYVELTLHEIDEDGYISDRAIAKTSFKFTVGPKSPILSYQTRSGDEEDATYDIQINANDYSENEIDGWELYVNKELDDSETVVIDGETYYLYSDNTIDNISQIDIQNGETLQFIARTYIIQNETDDSIQKVYSNWSDVTEITYGDGITYE